MELLRILQQEEAVTFTPKVVYDGQKIIFSTRDLLSADSQTVNIIGVYSSQYFVLTLFSSSSSVVLDPMEAPLNCMILFLPGLAQ
jgi:hypothetical protein